MSHRHADTEPRIDRRAPAWRRSLLFAAGVVSLLAASVAIAASGPPAGSACPPRSAGEFAALPLGCCSTSSDPRAHALGFGAALLGAVWWAPRRTS